MTHRTGERPHVLVVDDERSVAELYAGWLSEAYEVTTALAGRAAIEAATPDVDVVLLDRRMPGMSGEETLARLCETGVDAQVAMVTAVEPTTDVADLPFDDYLRKPASRERLINLVEQLLQCAASDNEARRHFELAHKLGLLETHLSADELAASETYAELQSRFEALNGELCSQFGNCSAATIRTAITGC